MNQAVTIVLLIDGDPMARAVTAATLKGCGCSVIPVRDAADGLETFSAHSTDIALVVTDVRLPDMDGVTLLQALHAIEPRMPVIAMTGSDPAEVAQYRHAHVAGVVQKPFRADQLVALVLHTLQLSPSALDAIVVPSTVPGVRPGTPRAAARPGSQRTPAAPPSFHWPLRREDLDVIEVVDAKTLRAVQFDPEPEPPIVETAVRESAHHLLERVQPIKPKGTIVRMPLVTTGMETHARPSPIHALRALRANRLVGATAATICGIAVTSYIEGRLTTSRERAVRAADESAPSTVGAPANTAAAAAARNDAHARATVTPSFENVPVMKTSVPASRVFGPTGLVRAQNVATRPVGRLLPPAATATPALQPAVASATPSRATFTTRHAAHREPEPTGLRKLLKTAVEATTEHVAKPTGRLAANAARHLGVLPESRQRSRAAERRSERQPSRRQVASRRETPSRVAARSVTPNMPQALPFTPATIDAGLASVRTPVAPAPAPVGVVKASTPAPSAAATLAANRPADEQRIYATLKQYEHAYERLDANAARAVWPSVDTRGLARAFGGLKTQELEFARCNLAVQTAEATAACSGRATYVPRVGNQQRRTESREWTFRLKKVDQSWMIVKAEAR